MKKRRFLIILGLTISMMGIITAVFTISEAAVSQNTITVNSLNDQLIPGNSQCTLREAINNANTDTDTTSGDCAPGSGDDLIIIPAGPLLLLKTGPDDDANLSGDLDILSSLTLQGAGSGQTLLDGDQEDRVLHIVTPGVVVEINDVYISNGHIDGQVFGYPDALAHGGGGILNEGGILTINDTIIQGNLINNRPGEDSSGAGILNVDGRLTLNNSLVSNNHISGSDSLSAGGGIVAFARNANAELTLVQSTVDLNTAGGYGGLGGGIGAASADGITITVSLSRTHVGNNEAAFWGGIIIAPVDSSSAISATIANSLIEYNRSEGGGGMVIGGGQPTRTHALIKNSTFQGNESVDVDPVLGGGLGGGLFASRVNLTVLGSTFSNNLVEEGENSFSAEGGGLYFQEGSLVIANSTFSGNEAVATGPGASSQGGGLAVHSGDLETTVTILNSTIVSNTAENGGGMALTHFSGVTPTILLQNSLIATNTVTAGPDQNCTRNGTLATMISLGNNLEDADTCNLNQPTDLINTNPLLGPLQDNGGPTLTHALLDFSPAIDSANFEACLAPPVNGIDQRGVLRPIGPRCDIGAVESAAISTYQYTFLPVFFKQ